MTEIEKQALALINEVRAERGDLPLTECDRRWNIRDGYLCRAIERHEAFRQEVSDTVEEALNDIDYGRPLAAKAVLRRFIIAKPDPLVEALDDMKDGRAGATTESYAACLRAVLAAHGLEIVEKKP